MTITIQSGDPSRLLNLFPTTFYLPERYLRHSKVHVDFAETLLKDVFVGKTYNPGYFQNGTMYITTNSEHIINRMRVAKKKEEITELIIQFFPFDHKQSVIEIKCDRNGSLSEYPDDFLDESSKQLMNLM